MHVRLAALLIVIATLILSFGGPSKSARGPSDLASICLSSSAKPSNVIQACTELIESEDVPTEQLVTYLRERGWAYYCNGQYELAIADDNHALRLRADDAKVLVARAYAHSAMEELDAARNDYAQAQRIAPDSTYVLFNKAKFDQKNGNQSDAIEGYERILELDPDHENAGERLAGILFKRNAFQEALEFLESNSDRWADKTWLHSQLGALHIVHTNDLEAALRAADAIQTLDADTEDQWLPYALIHLNIGSDREGLAFAEKFVQHVASQKIAEISLIDRFKWMLFGPADFELMASSVARANTLELLGRRDLARHAFYEYFETANIDGAIEMKRLLNNADGEVKAVSGQTLDALIDQYLDHHDLRLKWLPAPEL